MAATTLASRSFNAAVNPVRGRQVAGLLRINAGLVNAAHFRSTLRRNNVTRTLRGLVVNGHALTGATVQVRSLRTRAILKVTTSVTLSTSLVLRSVAPCRHVMATVNNFIRRLLTRYHLNDEDLNCCRRSTNVLIGTVRRSRFQIINVGLQRVTRIPNRDLGRNTVRISNSQVGRRSYLFIGRRRLIIFVGRVSISFFQLSTYFVAETIRRRHGSIIQTRLMVTLRQFAICVGGSNVDYLLGTITTLMDRLIDRVLICTSEVLINVRLRLPILMRIITVGARIVLCEDVCLVVCVVWGCRSCCC